MGKGKHIYFVVVETCYLLRIIIGPGISLTTPSVDSLGKLVNVHLVVIMINGYGQGRKEGRNYDDDDEILIMITE